MALFFDKFLIVLLTSFLAFIPFLRGGRADWAAFSTALAFISGTLIFFLLKLSKRSSRIAYRKSDLLILVSLLWYFFRLQSPFSPSDAFFSLFLLMGVSCAYFFFRQIAHEDKYVIPCLVSFACIGGIIASVGVLQILGVVDHSWWKPVKYLASTFVNHNHFAAYLEILLPLALVICLKVPMHSLFRLPIIFFTVVMSVCFVLSCSRGAWLSLFFSTFLVLLFFGVFKKINKRIIAGLFLGGGGLAVILFLFKKSLVFERLTTVFDFSSDTSARMRLPMWQGTWELIQGKLLQGWGPESFVTLFPAYRPKGLFSLINFAHNEYLHTIAEIGVIGLLGLCFFSVFVFFQLSALARFSKTEWKRAVGIAVLISFVSLSFHSFIDFPWRIPAIPFIFASLVGLVNGIYFHDNPKPPKEVSESTPGIFLWITRGFLILSFVALLFNSGKISKAIAADYLVYQGKLLAEKGYLKEAVGFYQEANTVVGYRPKVYRKLGDHLSLLAKQLSGRERQDSLRLAIEAYENVLKLNPQDGKTAHDLSVLVQSRGRLDQAGRLLEQAMQSDPNNPLYVKHWAELQHVVGNQEVAAEAYKKASSLALPYNFHAASYSDLVNPRHFVQQGQRAMIGGRYAYAQTSFEIALIFDSRQKDAKTGLAVALLNQGRADRAKGMVTFLKEDDELSSWFAEYAYYSLKNSQPGVAEGAIEKSLKLNASNVLAHQIRITLALRQNNKDQIEQTVDDLFSLNRAPLVTSQRDGNKYVTIWEPENRIYHKGEKTEVGWSLDRRATISQRMVLPSGKVRFKIRARAKTRDDIWPTMLMKWNGRDVLKVKVSGKEWSEYEKVVTVLPGESRAAFSFISLQKGHNVIENRSFEVDRITATWEIPS